jgi:tyrosyl-tRNA synthetase
MSGTVFGELRERGFVYQATDAEALERLLSNKKTVFYAGFDPTGPSLHAGHLLPVMAMRLLQRAGHKPVVLVGGATALIGDPSGKSEARPILPEETAAANAESLKRQLSRFISVDDAIFVNNADWFKGMGLLDFLRDTGSRFSVNKMLAAESVKMRLESGGISYLEFSYMLLQAYDFLYLNQKHGCAVQLGGQDQWGNIVAGVDLTRRVAQTEVFGFTLPLLTDSAGQKFGKTAGGALWLDPEKTSVFDYYQFWRNCDDADTGRLLALFTPLPTDEVKALGSLPVPDINRAKEILGYEATALAHGREAAAKAYLAACAKFGFSDPDGKIKTSSGITALSSGSPEALSGIPSFTVKQADLDAGVWIVKLLSDSGLCRTNSDARRLISAGGASLNDEKITDIDRRVTSADLSGGSAILKAGKKNLKKIIAG